MRGRSQTGTQIRASPISRGCPLSTVTAAGASARVRSEGHARAGADDSPPRREGHARVGDDDALRARRDSGIRTGGIHGHPRRRRAADRRGALDLSRRDPRPRSNLHPSLTGSIQQRCQVCCARRPWVSAFLIREVVRHPEELNRHGYVPPSLLLPRQYLEDAGGHERLQKWQERLQSTVWVWVHAACILSPRYAVLFFSKLFGRHGATVWFLACSSSTVAAVCFGICRIVQWNWCGSSGSNFFA